MKNNTQNRLINLSSILLVLIPLTLISGPFIPDLFLVIIVIIFISITYTNKEYEIYKNKFLIFFIIFFLIILCVSIFSLNISSVKSSLTYIRFAIFALAVSWIIDEKKFLLNNILYILLTIYLVLFIDTIYQYNFSKNLIGLSYENIQNFRITSFFGKDEVLGSYVVRFLPLVIFLTILRFESSIIKKRIVVLFLIITSFIIILFSGERTSLALFILLILFLFFSSVNLRRVLIAPLFISLIAFILVISVSEKIKYRVIDQTVNQIGLSKDSERLFLFSKTYEGHYLISYKMFKEKPFFGHGAKMFRFYCIKKENYIAPNACTTHPHNFYAQFLAETGLVGFIFLLGSFFYLSFLFMKNFYYQVRYRKQFITDAGLCLIASYFITIFPILPSGNFFNNWLSIIIYYPMGFLIYIIKKNKFYV